MLLAAGKNMAENSDRMCHGQNSIYGPWSWYLVVSILILAFATMPSRIFVLWHKHIYIYIYICTYVYIHTVYVMIEGPLSGWL